VAPRTAETAAASFAGRTRNVGVACGPSGLLVVDEDELDGFTKFAASVGESVPATFTVATGNGRHFYFAAPEGVTLGNKAGPLDAFGCDVRGVGGYVVGPGSVRSGSADP
jgi:hypothetical protein